MRIHIVAVGQRMPSWVDQACNEYFKRMPAYARVELHEVPAPKRTKGADRGRVLREECERIRAATPLDCRAIALERTGRPIDSEQLACSLRSWFSEARDVALWIGGPDGLAPECLRRAGERWSLSALTLAHPVARVLLAEQLYRAWSIVGNLPYHR